MNSSEYMDFEIEVLEVANVVTLSTGKQKIRYLVKISLLDSSESYTDYVDKFTSTMWNNVWYRCTNPVFTPKQDKEFKKEMQKRAAALPVKEVLLLDRPGLFHYRGYDVFVFGDKPLGYLPDNISVEISEELSKNYHMKPMCFTDETKMKYLHRVFSAAGRESGLIFYTSLLGPLKQVFYDAGYPLNVVTNLYGESSSQKSLFAKCYYLFFNKDRPSNNCMSTFKTVKKKEIKEKIQMCSGMNYLIDDMHFMNTGKKSEIEKECNTLDTIERESELYPMGANVVITSEERGSIQISIQDRQIQIHIGKTHDNKWITWLVQNSWILPNIVMQFMEQVMKNYSKVIGVIKKRMTNLYLAKGSVNRGDEHREILLIVQDLFCELYVPERFRKSFRDRKDITGILNETTAVQQQHMNSLCLYSYVDYHCFWIRILLGSGILTVVEKPRDLRNGELDVCYYYGKAYIKREALQFGLQRWFNDTKDRTKITVEALRAANIIDVSSDSNQINYTKKIPGDQRRCYVIDTKELDSYIALAKGNLEYFKES